MSTSELTKAKKPANTRSKATTPRTKVAAAKSTATPEPGVKPRFLVVEKAFFVQTSNGELRLSLAMSFGSLMKLMTLEAENEFAEFEFLMNNIFTESELEQLNLLEWTETVEILMEYMTAFQKLVGTSMGKFGGSSAS